jgi:hypothetical protein
MAAAGFAGLRCASGRTVRLGRGGVPLWAGGVLLFGSGGGGGGWEAGAVYSKFLIVSIDYCFYMPISIVAECPCVATGI